ncbi:hypothetical protein KAR91_15500 [Candidatus Pacearchaeota archaeon]|nr:hypothetical protein [Candidatus Pacearchaeota archaeon]
MKDKQIPKGALRFVDEGQGCQAFVELEDGDKTPKLNMVAYSGKTIKGHWYWGDLTIDLSGMKFLDSKYVVLENHDTERKVAFMGKPKITEDHQLLSNPNAKFVDTEAANEFIKLSKEGFPYQSSMSVRPTNVERLEEGAKAEVNGFKVKGPHSIFRACKFREMSVCVFGWDSKTKATAYSKELVDLQYEEKVINAEEELDENNRPILKRRKEVKKSMDLNEMKEEHADLYEAVLELGREAAEAEFSKEKTVMEAKLETMQTDNDAMSTKVLYLEKKDTIRSENELKADADRIWTEKLSASKIPERYYDKVQPHVGHSKFVKDGKFDAEKFGEAVDAEIKDWEDRGMTESVLGSGFSEKEVDESSTEATEQKEEDEKTALRLLKHVGQEPKKEQAQT